MNFLFKIALSSLLLFSSHFAFGQKEKPTHLEKEVKCFVSNSDFEVKKCNDAIHLSQNSEEKERCFSDEGLIIANSTRFVSSITADYEVIENIGECALQIGENGVSEIATVLVVRKNGEYYLGKVVSGAGNSFGKNAISSINGFSDNITSILSQRGLSLSDFKLLQQKRYDLMTAAENAHINAIRNSIPNPNSNTIIQKVIALNKIDDYIVKGYKPRGFVTTAADSKHLNTYDEIYDGMRLDYGIDEIGTLAFNTSDNGCYVIRFKATNANLATPAVNLPNPQPFPFTNNGFTSGKNSMLGVPEWEMPDAEIIVGVIYRKNIDGSEIEYAIWDATLNKFILK